VGRRASLDFDACHGIYQSFPGDFDVLDRGLISVVI